MKASHCGNKTHLMIIIFRLITLEERSDNDLVKNGVQSGTFLRTQETTALAEAGRLRC